MTVDPAVDTPDAHAAGGVVADTTPAQPARRRSRLRGCLAVAGYGMLAIFLLLAGFLLYWNVTTNRAVAQFETFAYTDDAPGDYVTVDGYQKHVRQVGSSASGGVPLLLVHGFNANAGYEFAEIEPLLAESRRLLIPDLVGFGYSERETEPGAIYTDAGQAAALVAMLDELGVDQVDVVGASYGGGAAAQLALDYPERVRRVILSGADLYTEGGGIFEVMGELPMGFGRANTFSAMGAGGRGSFLFTLGCQADGWCPEPWQVERRQRLASIAGTTDAYVAMSATENVTRLPQDLPQITQPTLVIWGEKDAL
ncbi:MAG: alpha/beta fold hydrolase, partial [Caldilineaceae bacterium]